MKDLQLSRHAETVMAERGIQREWIERVLRQPEWTEFDPNDPSLRRAYGTITECDDRVLRVVYTANHESPRVITAFFDRNRRGFLGKDRK
ncbi:MAG: DUF4258 domain-containing protein [Rhodospirillales bacterium]|nr:DUF4258 domain-containing protein [Rhodospirillales bacterium]